MIHRDDATLLHQVAEIFTKEEQSDSTGSDSLIGCATEQVINLSSLCYICRNFPVISVDGY
jgi:hypothetical protein